VGAFVSFMSPEIEKYFTGGQIGKLVSREN